MEKPHDTQAGFEQLLRQQTMLARFGEFTLRSEDLTDILQEACRLVAEGLSARFAKILELQDGNRMLVRAGVGWRPGRVGHEIVMAEAGTYEALALTTRESRSSSAMSITRAIIRSRTS